MLITFAASRSCRCCWLWRAGRTSPQEALCNITCATSPCFVLPAGGVYNDEYFTAPGPNVYQLAGQPQTLAPMPMRCACTDCLGLACESTYWVPSGSAASCPMLKIGNDSFYQPICRSNDPPSTYGWTGWVIPGDPGGVPDECTGYKFLSKDYSVFCPQASPSGEAFGVYLKALLPQRPRPVNDLPRHVHLLMS